jgi:hypothetical protein
MTARRLAAQKLQGRYMGALAGLTAGQKAKVKKVKSADGYTAAFRLAAKLRA